MKNSERLYKEASSQCLILQAYCSQHCCNKSREGLITIKYLSIMNDFRFERRGSAKKAYYLCIFLSLNPCMEVSSYFHWKLLATVWHSISEDICSSSLFALKVLPKVSLTCVFGICKWIIQHFRKYNHKVWKQKETSLPGSAQREKISPLTTVC